MSDPVLLTFNAGSSSIKLGLFSVVESKPRRIGGGMVDLRQMPPALHMVESGKTTQIALKAAAADDMRAPIDETLGWLTRHFALDGIAAAGHRVVHGGDRFAGPCVITDETFAAIKALAPLAPMHQPSNLRLIEAMRQLLPRLPQGASFDTAFHRTQSDLVRRFALPRALFDQGVKRYGFHGLSYKFIAGELLRAHPEIAAGRVIVAHLGSGASLCALEGGVSRDTTMSFSVLDGIPMATRCGALDPGVVIHMVKELGWSIQKVEDVLYHQSGLLGISGISADTRNLLANPEPEAREALDIFAFRISREVAALANTLGGIDALVFTGGIGEHQRQVRENVCRRLAWLGIRIDAAANQRNATRIDAPGGAVAVLVIPTDEEQVIADEACAFLAKTGGPP